MGGWDQQGQGGGRVGANDLARWLPSHLFTCSPFLLSLRAHPTNLILLFAFTACEVRGASGGGEGEGWHKGRGGSRCVLCLYSLRGAGGFGGGGARGGARGKTKEVQACQSLFVPRLLFIPAACDGRS